MDRLLQILFWSVIAAAFVGPGTVTTCARAGLEHRYALLWAVAFSTLACLVLQEASARVTVLSGRDLGRALRTRFHGGVRGALVLVLVVGAIVVGCAAYQAGNLLGAVAGAVLPLGADPPWSAGTLRGVATLVISGVASLLLWFARTRTIARVMGLVVAVMGVAFLATALMLRPAPADLVRGLALPTIPAGAGLVVLGLIGTTVVPYNLFLGSGLARGQRLSDIRFGLGVSVLLGGAISAAIVVVGSALSGSLGADPSASGLFSALADTLSERLGGWARVMFAVALFSAGFSSAITAPLAAAVTARGLFSTSEDDPRFGERAYGYRLVWIGVMLSGAVFALTAVRPLHAIVLAQALNGVLLPSVAIFLMVVVNDRRLMGERGVNGWAANLVLGTVVAVTLVLGLRGVFRAIGSLLS
jgi:Mn2+/Fe2+ NRAMP family transporter